MAEGCRAQLQQLKEAIAEDSDPCWAELVGSEPTVAELEELVLKCRAVEDEVRLKHKAARRQGKAGGSGSWPKLKEA